MRSGDILSLLEEVERVANPEPDQASAQPRPAVREVVTPPPLAPASTQPIADNQVASKPSAAEAVEPASRGESDAVQTKPARAAQEAAASFASGSATEGDKPDVAKETPAFAEGGAVSWHDQVPTGTGQVAARGLTFVFGFLGLFFLWSVLFPISSAVVAAGKIVSNGQNKLIQHPTGGVVREILASDGERVEQGSVIVLLDKSVSKAELSGLLARKNTLMAQKARYEAERSGSGAGFNTAAAGSSTQLRGGQSADETGSNTMLDEQRLEFDAGRKRLNAQLDAASFQIETLKNQRSGLKARMAGERKLLDYADRELRKIRPLAEDGYLPKARLWELEKTRLEHVTKIENFSAEIDATSQRISEAEANLAQLEEADRETRSEELSKVIGELAELQDRILAAKTAVDLTELRAPVSGTIVKLEANTVGGVIAPGKPIAEIVPDGAALESEFRIPLNKVKFVKAGQPVRISVTTFNRRTYDQIEGEVTYVSADSVLDEMTGESYFLARAKMKPDPNKRTGIEELSAGMATEVYVLAEPRVFASYVLQPLYDSFNKAFREIN